MGNWKIWAIIGSVFISGIIVGVVGVGVVMEHQLDGHRDPSTFRLKIKERIIEDIVDEVEPDSSVVPAISEIVDDMTLQMEAFRREDGPKIRSIFENGKTRIEALLTPEQQERLEELVDKRRKGKFGLFRLPPPPPPPLGD